MIIWFDDEMKKWKEKFQTLNDVIVEILLLILFKEISYCFSTFFFLCVQID